MAGQGEVRLAFISPQRSRLLRWWAMKTHPLNRLPKEKQIAVVAALVEGMSIRATVRMTGVAKNTVTNLLVDLGRACEAYQIERLVNLPCKRLQCDEIWSFVGAKQKNVPIEKQGHWGIGDVWTWTAI